MDTSSDQIQADIARTRARMEASLGSARGSSGSQGAGYAGGSYQGRQTSYAYQVGQGNTGEGGLVDQIRRRPLVALGLSLVAGSLLQDYLSGQQQASPSYQAGYRGPGSTVGGTSYGGQQSSVRQGVSSAAQTVTGAAQSVGETASDVTQRAVDTARDAASTVADTARDAASAVAETTVDVAYRVADTAGNVTGEVTERVGDVTSTLTDYVRRQPLVAVGVSLAAGSLLQQYLSGGQGSSRSSSMGARSPYYTDYRPSYPDYPVDYSTVAGADAYMRSTPSVGQATRSAAGAVGDAAQSVAGTASGVTRRAVDTTVDAASTVRDTAVDAASTVADTAVDVAQRAGSLVAGAADQVVDTAGSAAGQVAETVGDLWPAITRQVQDRPLTSLGVAIGAGMLLQPTLAPHVRALTGDVRDLWGTVSGGVGELAALPEPPEVQRIKEAVVPATVNRTRQFIGQDVRQYLDRSLEGVVGQSSLRAGVVAAITERAEDLVGRRAPNLLNGLSGTLGLLVLGLAGAVLEARNQAQQGQGQTMTNVRTQLSQSIVQNAQEQLSRYFPEFRQQLESQSSGPQQCSNCGTQIAPNTRFCPSCGTPVSAGTSV